MKVIHKNHELREDNFGVKIDVNLKSAPSTNANICLKLRNIILLKSCVPLTYTSL